ncbi:protein phosphatase EYA [Elaeis guineensis]|uniref:protein-tyrosine-phosphatase n=1 Tax=Elaeis guineensis var. tenera TaxID=51953 RepID=A0A6I9S081_ELAGV|nr:eyes absent homolog [Elaeis guineensis]
MDDLVEKSPAVSCQNTEVSKKAVKVCPINVYIWDMDETLILLKSLLDGTYAGVFNGLKDTRKGVEIGKRWENHIIQVCDEYFFYEEIENFNEPFLNALSEYDDGRDLSNYDFNNDGFGAHYDDSNKRKLAYRHRSIAQKYAQGLQKVLDQEMIKLWNDLYNLTDSYTDGWLSSGHALLEQTLGRNRILAPELASSETASGSMDTKCQNINVLVTSGSLIPSLVKCLLYRLDNVISHDNVYSSWEVGKLQCFSWIKERFDGPNVQFCVIGDGLEECEAAQIMRWPFIKIDFRPDGPHRFPGLTMKMVHSYIDVIYGPAHAEAENDDE